MKIIDGFYIIMGLGMLMCIIVGIWSYVNDIKKERTRKNSGYYDLVSSVYQGSKLKETITKKAGQSAYYGNPLVIEIKETYKEDVYLDTYKDGHSSYSYKISEKL